MRCNDPTSIEIVLNVNVFISEHMQNVSYTVKVYSYWI